jgi:hypothetical protein
MDTDPGCQLITDPPDPDLQHCLFPVLVISENFHLFSICFPVNIGYKRLQKPLNRALYLLELHSLTLEEGQIHVDPEFLMEVRGPS